MSELTANQRYLGISLIRIQKQYENELANYDGLFEQFEISTNEQEADWELIQKLNDIHQEVTGLKYIIVLNVAAYIEAIINFYLSHRLSPDKFSAVENCKPIDKWVHIVELLVPNYEIKKGSELYGLLKTLIETRNSITHMKPQINNETSTIHKGNIPKHFVDDHTDRNTIGKWITLPDKLLDNLCELDSSFSAKSTKLFSRPKFEG